MKLTIGREKEKFVVSGYRFFATAEKLYIDDKAVELSDDSKIIIDAWEIRLGKVKSERTKLGERTIIAEEIDLYTFPYLIVQNLAEEFGYDNTLLVKVAKE
jgi:hypothetical protein